MDEKKIQENLSQAFEILSLITVSGEDVDRMFFAKAKLREAFQALPKEKPEKEVKNNG